MPIGVIVLLAALVATAAVAWWYQGHNGRFHATAGSRQVFENVSTAGPASTHVTPPPDRDALTADDIGVRLGERATLVQFSTAFCAPCRSARTLLRDVAGKRDGVAYVDVDAESHLELVRVLNIMRTPTILVLGPDGSVRERASGLPSRAEPMWMRRSMQPRMPKYETVFQYLRQQDDSARTDL